jgi:ribosome biogenesis protein Tsr3
MAKLKYKTQLIKYSEASPHYIEVFVNIKRVVKVESITQQDAIERALRKEERKLWRNIGYEFVDCDYNTVKRVDFERFKLTTREQK